MATTTSTATFEEQYHELVRQYRVRDGVTYNPPKQETTAAQIVAVIQQPEPETAAYNHWRQLKQQAKQMLRDNPIIQRFVTGQLNKRTYNKHYAVLAAWAELKATIAEFEKQHAGSLRQWQKQVIAERPQEPEQPRGVRIFGRMGTRAQKLRHELSFRLWAAIRYLDPDGGNGVPVDLVHETFSDDGCHTITSQPNLRKQINKAIERGYMHYSKDRSKLYYTSETRVALEVLGLSAVGGWAVRFSIEELTQDFVNNRALLHSSFHASCGDGFSNPISRESIQQETGRWEKTQRKYEKSAGVEISSNWEFVGHAERAMKPVDNLRVVGSGKDKMRVKQLPNSYAANTKTVKRRRRWLNRRIGYLCKYSSDNGQQSPIGVMGSCDSEIKPKRYFKKPPKVSEDTVRFHPLPGSPWLWKRIE